MARQGRRREPTAANIQAFWDAEARDIGETPQVTIRDLYFRSHELHTMLPLLPRAARLLDAGCGTGLGTLVLGRRAERTVGIDVSPAMVAWARRLQADPAHRAAIGPRFSPLWDVPAPPVEFRAADVLTLDLEPPAFDVITTQRLLINLPTRDDQGLALRRLRAHAAADAVLVAAETTEQGYARIDALRARFELPPLERHWHNLSLDEDLWSTFRQAGWKVEAVLSFDTYMLLSKLVYPAAAGPAQCTFLSGANEAAMEVACLYRTRFAADEIGVEALLGLYLERVRRYDAPLAGILRGWAEENAGRLGDWSRLGPHRLIVAQGC